MRADLKDITQRVSLAGDSEAEEFADAESSTW
jgi:hypothetical protein